MSYYHNKEKNDPQNTTTRKNLGKRNVNDPFYGTGPVPPVETFEKEQDPSIPKEYDASKNSGGTHSSTEKPEQ